MSANSWVSKAKKILSGLAVILSFCLTVFLLYSDKTASATVSLALFFGLIIFGSLPIFESFKILGLEGKLRDRINEAEKITNDLQKTARTLSEISISSVAMAGRWGGSSSAEKAAKIEAVKENLAEIGLDEKVIHDVVRPAIRMAAFDLFHVFASAAKDLCEAKKQELSKQIAQLKSKTQSGDNEANIERLQALLGACEVQPQGFGNVIYANPKLDDVASLSKSLIASIPLDHADKLRLEKLADALSIEVDRMLKDSMLDAQFMDKFDFSKDHAKKAFAVFNIQ